jgi:hypothetical protein
MLKATALILLSAMLGQVPANGHPPKVWLDTTSPVDGKPIRIMGWIEAGQVRFDPAQYPQFVARPAMVGAVGAIGTTPPTGVIGSKFPAIHAGESWNGGNVVGATAEAKARSKSKSPDVYLTIIGPEKERDKVRTRLARDPEFKALARDMGDRLAVETYAPTNPLVADVNLPGDGHPDIVVLDASGKECGRFREDPGPSILAEAVRKADPSYHQGGERDASPGIVNLGWMLVGIVSAFFIIRAARKAQSA